MEINLDKVNLEIAVENVDELSNEEYALKRKQGLGATDSSVYLGLMKKFRKDKATVLAEKVRPTITEEEKAIGQLEAVRKGRDLEDLILQKFGEVMQCEKPFKPRHMYRVKDFPQLTINYDGIHINKEGDYIPIECKFVTVGGDKNYNATLAKYKEDVNIGKESAKEIISTYKQNDIASLITMRASQVGIPPYYYPQLQQQILGLNAPYGYLAALHDKGWRLCIYKVNNDGEVINQIIVQSTVLWDKVKDIKGEA